jgi:DNA repair protein RadA/Sms
MRLAKSLNVPIIIVGHINKDGDIAGPKILEHMVDTVLQFENTRDSNIRFLRTIKNRFGSTDEVGIFRMESYGLIDLTNPSEIFLSERSDGMIFAAREGKRTLLLEMQALALNSDYNNPRRVANGIEISRLHQILAIVEKKLGVSLSKSDI